METEQCPVLWVDIDNGEDVTTERLAAFTSARKVPPETPIYWICFPDPPMVAVRGLGDLKEFMLANHIGLVVIDNLLRIAGLRDENASEMDIPMLNLRKLAEDTGAAVCIIHHKRKDAAGQDRDHMRGHSSIAAGIDLAFQIYREGMSDLVTFKCTKARRRPFESCGACGTYKNKDDNETLQEARFWRTAPGEVEAESKAKDELCERIIAALADGPKNQAELIAVSGKAKMTVAARLNDLVLEGRIKSVPGPRRSIIYSLGEQPMEHGEK